MKEYIVISNEVPPIRRDGIYLAPWFPFENEQDFSFLEGETELGPISIESFTGTYDVYSFFSNGKTRGFLNQYHN